MSNSYPPEFVVLVDDMDRQALVVVVGAAGPVVAGNTQAIHGWQDLGNLLFDRAHDVVVEKGTQRLPETA